MNKMGLYPQLVAGTLIVAVLATVMFDGGWMIWIPVLPALWVTDRIHKMLDL